MNGMNDYDESKSIPNLLNDDNIIDKLSINQLTASLNKHIFRIDDLVLFLQKIKSKYEFENRMKIIQHIHAEFWDENIIDLIKFEEFLSLFSEFLQCDVFSSISDVVKRILKKFNAQNIQSSIFPQIIKNNNIKNLRNTTISSRNFDKIYGILLKIANEQDYEAAAFAVKEDIHTLQDDLDVTILATAFTNNNFKLWKLLIESGADYMERDRYGNYALHHFCRNDNLEAVKYILKLPNINPNVSGFFKTTPLMDAATYGAKKVVEFLKTVPNIDAKAKNHRNRTALDLALNSNALTLISVLQEMQYC